MPPAPQTLILKLTPQQEAILLRQTEAIEAIKTALQSIAESQATIARFHNSTIRGT
jgi:hypothetical protein